MAGIYVHIPFCKQACNYCNFHFSTSLRFKNELLAALLKETELQKDYLENETVETIYFGGGTPSLLTIEELKLQLEKLGQVFDISAGAEITLEANPDDIDENKLTGWKKIGINRLSIGVQSFFEEDLLWMNRGHNAQQAIDSLQLATRHFHNITVDLIYGHPLLTNEKWRQNVEQVISLNIPHVSCYALTVEPKTPLQKLILEKKKENIQQEKQADHFLLLMQWLQDAGFEHYEISNFSKPGFCSRHNSSYWQGKKYLGLGPSAHSFDGKSRQWNISNNNIYIESLSKNELPFEKEMLTPVQQLNEYIMTSLRTKEGLDLARVQSSEFGPDSHRDRGQDLEIRSQKFINEGTMVLRENKLILTKEGKLFADGIAADLFIDPI
ncbi:MAG TPA: radical SAM family heme chaperone HemW [Chitinophagaceae bacterium]|nr:radical SAM family heme chaperone HemW [Chitinophagaceae bacterium]